MISFAGFDLPGVPTSMMPNSDCPGGCSYLIPICTPAYLVCYNGVCKCYLNNASTKKECHNDIDREKQS